MKQELEYLKDSEYTLVFYEAPHRIEKTLKMMLDVLGDRYISIYNCNRSRCKCSECKCDDYRKR